jgi:hypothetical protein
LAFAGHPLKRTSACFDAEFYVEIATISCDIQRVPDLRRVIYENRLEPFVKGCWRLLTAEAKERRNRRAPRPIAGRKVEDKGADAAGRFGFAEPLCERGAGARPAFGIFFFFFIRFSARQ